jgi:hypothetical protein
MARADKPGLSSPDRGYTGYGYPGLRIRTG